MNVVEDRRAERVAYFFGQPIGNGKKTESDERYGTETEAKTNMGT